MEILFYDDDGTAWTEDDVFRALEGIGAGECETLFLHSDVALGKPPRPFRRKEYVASLAHALERLGVRHLVVPTFTYSFCNHEVYDVRNSKTYMGALNEHFRKQPGRCRTMDPLLSLSVPEELKDCFVGGVQSFPGQGQRAGHPAPHGQCEIPVPGCAAEGLLHLPALCGKSAGRALPV